MNPQSLYSLASALLTGVITLLAVNLTNKANYKKLLRETDIEKEFKTNEILREKLEELYVLFSKWITFQCGYWLPYHKVMLGEISYNQAHDINLKREKKNDDFERIEMLVDLYFPTLRKEYEDLISTQDKVNQILSEHKRGYKKGDADGLKFASLFLDEQNVLFKKSDCLKKNIINLQKLKS